MHACNSEHECTKFKSSSLTSTLWAHLARFHLDKWIEHCNKEGIPTRWKETEAAVHSYKKFSNEAFVDALAEFIIQDDQVQSN